MYLITRPFVWIFKGIKWLVGLPARTYRSIRDRRHRSRVKGLVKADRASKRSTG